MNNSPIINALKHLIEIAEENPPYEEIEVEVDEDCAVADIEHRAAILITRTYIRQLEGKDNG